MRCLPLHQRTCSLNTSATILKYHISCTSLKAANPCACHIDTGIGMFVLVGVASTTGYEFGLEFSPRVMLGVMRTVLDLIATS
jgi:hypothetical protein